MSDGRKNNGAKKGENRGQGRKSKAEEFKLIEKLDKIKEPDYAIKKMFDHIENGSEKMLDLYMGYRFGKPKQAVDHTTGGDSFNEIPIISWVNNESKGEDFMDQLENEK